MKNTIQTLLVTLILVCQLAFADGFEIVEEKEYNKDSIGKLYTYSQQMVYLNLVNSPEGFLEKNAGIERMLARGEQAEGNDVHVKENVNDGTKFKLVKIFKVIHTNLDEWAPGARELYLGFAKNNPDVDMIFVLEDENGILSTVRAGNYRRAIEILN